MLQFENLSKTYGHVIALQNVSFGVKKGEIRGLLGGNGSGKSTLVKIAGGAVVPDSGKIFINNQEVRVNSPKKAIKKGLVMTSQELSIVPNLSVWENMFLSVMPVHGGIFIDKNKAKSQCLAMLEELGIGHQINANVHALPKNEQYMLELGKALIQVPDILMVDEITSALYTENVEVVRKKLQEYKKQGKIVLFISHRMEELYSICDSVTVMRNGEVIGTHDISEKNGIELLTLMVGKEFASIQKIKTAGTLNLGRPLISAKNIPMRRYGKFLSLDVAKGEIIGVAGLQGHGQSDIVRTLHGLGGDIEITMEDRQIILKNPHQAVKQGFAFISGDRELEGVFREHSIANNITVVKELVDKKNLKHVENVLDSIKVIYAGIHQNLTSLSGGNQQKVIVGRWTSTDPMLILADDPTKGIDVQARKELHSLFAEMTLRGVSLIIVSSDDNELVSLCSCLDNSRVIVLYEGEIVKTLRGNEITRENILAAAIPQKKGKAHEPQG
jgi:ABC-type sugar transport system ATPase subunit